MTGDYYDPIDDPKALVDILTHAGTPADEDDTYDVVVFHNVDSSFDPFEPWQKLAPVAAFSVPVEDPYDICEEVWAQLQGGGPAVRTPWAVKYFAANRSLSVGDVITVDAVPYAVDIAGFTRLGGIELNTSGLSEFGTLRIDIDGHR